MAWLGTLAVAVILLLPESTAHFTGVDTIPHGTAGYAIGRLLTAFVLAAVAVKGWAWLQDDPPTNPKTHANINWSALGIGALSWLIGFLK